MHWLFHRLAPAGLLLALLGCSTPRSPGDGQEIRLRLLHTNDVHARFLEFDRFGGSCREQAAAAGECFGGVARRATAVAEARRGSVPTLLLDAGDQFQGTLFFSKFKGAAAARVMNALGYDAMVVGNHEFDDGPPVLARFVDAVEFPVLGTNVITEREPELAGRLERSVRLQRGGATVGIVGYITEETPTLSSPGPTLSFAPIVESVREEVERLEADGIELIVALSHAGYQRDLEVAAAISGIDVIIGGHTNTRLGEGDGAQGPYPTLVRSPRGEPVLVVTAFAWGMFLGDLEVTFRDGIAAAWSGQPRLLDAGVPEDPEIAALIEPLAEEVAEFSSTPIGETLVRLRGDEASCRFGECNLGNLLTDAMLAHGRLQGVEIALQNAGGIRSSISAGPVTVGNVLEVLPFGNTSSTFRLLGADVRAALEHGASRAENPDNDGTGRFLQVAGLRYRWDVDRPPGQRIVAVEVASADGAWQPLDDDREYSIISNAFSRNGGDGFDVLAERAIDPYDQGQTLADILIAHFQKHSPVSPELEGRIVEVDQR